MPKIIIQALDKEWSVELREGSNTVGRSTKCTIPVQEQNISREHCEIVFTGGVATLFDKGSMNGTILNGKRIWEQKLNAGDQIRIVNAVLWFEKKGKSYSLPQEKKGRSTVPDESTGKRETDIQTRRVGGTKRTEVKRSLTALVPDYSAWGRSRGNWGAILGGVGGLAALLVVALVGIKFLGGDDGPIIDRDNLLRNNSGFEASSPGEIPGWKLDPPANSELGVTESAARGGKNSLVLTKSRSPEQSIVSAMLSAKMKANSDSYRLSAWVKWGTFTGRVALKISWVRNDGVLFESCSEPVEKSSDWIELSETFARPAGAQAFRIGISTLGRGGRIYIDDLRLEAGGEVTSAKPVSLGSWSVQASDRGSVSIAGRGKVLLNNIHLGLENEREGVSSQMFLPAEGAWDGNSFRVTGELLHPVPALAETIPYTLSFRTQSDQLWVMYEFDPEDLREVDRIIIFTRFPRSVTPSSVSGSARFFEFSVRDDEFALRYPGEVPQLQRTENGLRQVFPVTEGEKGKTWVGFAVLSIGKEDPLSAAREKEGDYPGEALEILRGAQRRMTLNQQDAKRVTKKVQQLLKLESREWEGVEASVYISEALVLPVLVEEARTRLASYQRRWSSGEFAEKAGNMKALLSQVEVGGLGDAARELSRARQYFEAGSGALAEEILLALLVRHPNGFVAEEARDLLQTVQVEE